MSWRLRPVRSRFGPYPCPKPARDREAQRKRLAVTCCRDGPAIRLEQVTDGTTETILLGETLPQQCEFQRFGRDYGWAGDNSVSQGQTIQPINYPIDDTDRTTFINNCASGCANGDPTHCIMNWHITWGFKSKHPGGTNFAFVDGSVHFVSQAIDHQTYQYLGCRHDAQVVNWQP